MLLLLCFLNAVVALFFKCAIPGLFLFIYVFYTVISIISCKYTCYKILPMTGFEPRISVYCQLSHDHYPVVALFDASFCWDSKFLHI